MLLLRQNKQTKVVLILTPGTNETRFDGGDDTLILMEDGPQLVNVMQHDVLVSITPWVAGQLEKYA
jgi:hypothetical protein